MTIPYERTMAVLRARELLMDLAYGGNRRDKRTLQAHAKWLLKHYPDLHHMKLSARSLSDVWGDPEGGYLDQHLDDQHPTDS